MSVSNKEKYRKLCEEKNIPLFMQAWWMDAVCFEGKKWDVLFAELEGEIKGVLVYHIIQKFGFKLILQPQLTQYNGIWIDYPSSVNEDRKLSLEKKIMDTLTEQLEQKDIHYFSQKFHYSITNWQPLYWKGFKQTTHYTFQIKNISNTDEAYNSFSYAKKKQLKKAANGFSINLSMSAKAFYELHNKSLLANGKKISYTESLFQSIYQASISREQGAIISAKDKHNNIHAALFLVWDNESAYDLISTINPDYKSSGASTLVVWEAIKMLSNKTKRFDFEGSMIEGVARSFQQFGTEQIPYFNISKTNSKSLSLLLKLKQLWK